LEVIGPQAGHVCAFARRFAAPSAAGPKTAVVIAPCSIASLTPSNDGAPTAPPTGPAVWADTCVVLGTAASGELKNWFTGQVSPLENSCLPMAVALADFPLALMADV
jgi:maltooligosyltrehalose synthase